MYYYYYYYYLLPLCLAFTVVENSVHRSYLYVGFSAQNTLNISTVERSCVYIFVSSPKCTRQMYIDEMCESEVTHKSSWANLFYARDLRVFATV
jgi:hypothetical protein